VGKYRWLINQDQSISAYGCRSLLASFGSLDIITRLWKEAQSLKDRVYFTWEEYYWDRSAIQELYNDPDLTWSNDPTNTVDKEIIQLNFGFVNYLDNGEKSIGSKQVSLLAPPPALYTVWAMQVQTLYFTEWKKGAELMCLPDWHIWQKDFTEITNFSNSKLIKKKFNFIK
jgi:hypothetical protein